MLEGGWLITGDSLGGATCCWDATPSSVQYLLPASIVGKLNPCKHTCSNNSSHLVMNADSRLVPLLRTFCVWICCYTWLVYSEEIETACSVSVFTPVHTRLPVISWASSDCSVQSELIRCARVWVSLYRYVIHHVTFHEDNGSIPWRPQQWRPQTITAPKKVHDGHTSWSYYRQRNFSTDHVVGDPFRNTSVHDVCENTR